MQCSAYPGVNLADWYSVTSDRGGKVIGLNPNIRVYRYVKGHFFDAHCKSTLSSTHHLSFLVPRTEDRLLCSFSLLKSLTPHRTILRISLSTLSGANT